MTPSSGPTSLFFTPADNRRRSVPQWIALNLLVLVVYSIAGLVIVYFGFGPAQTSPVFPPSGIAVAATLILGPGILPSVWLGQFINNFPLFHEPQTTPLLYTLVNLGTSTGSTLEALFGAMILRRLTGAWHPFARSSHVVVFLLGSSIAASTFAAGFGTFSLWMGGYVPRDQVSITLITYFLSDAAGITVFGSFILAWYREPSLDAKIAKDTAIILVTVLLIAALGIWTRYPIDYLYVPLMLWAGFRAGARGVTFTAVATTVVTILVTIRGHGSFVGKTDNESILLLEGFMAVINFTGLLVVAVRSQQIEADEALEAHNRMLEQRVRERTAEVAEKNRQLEEKQARIAQDLHTTQLLQASILPTDFSQFAETEIAASMKPALEVGGDFYDVFQIAEGRLGFVVADVSGKGVAAAFFMAVTRTMLRGIAQSGLTPADCIAHVNEALCRENPIDMFVTVLYAELNETSGKVTCVNAGHCEPIINRAGTRAELVKRTGNPPLGVLVDRKFREQTFTLAPGQTLFLYSDGATEASNREGDLYRVPRLLAAAEQYSGRSPQELMLGVIGSVEAFSAGTVQADDITFLVVRRN